MEIKLIELRDRATFIPMMAVRLGGRDEAERYLTARAGYGRTVEEQKHFILFGRLDEDQFRYSPYGWLMVARTIPEAHKWLVAHWDEVKSGDVLDLEYVLGETDKPKCSEREDGVPC